MLLAGVAWNLVLFALLRSSWFEHHALAPFANLQAAVALWYAGEAAAPVTVTLECSGADTLALCAGFMLAYPATWRRRLLGVATVLPLLLLLNIVRIGTLSAVAGSPTQFRFLHGSAWPALFILAATGLVYLWMRPARKSLPVSGRTARAAIYSFGAFAIATPWVAPSAAAGKACQLVATMASAVMHVFGASVVATGAVLSTPRGGFVVTPECILSPVIPLWITAVYWWSLSRRGRALGLLLTLPVVATLATLRLLVLAAPGAWVASPIVLVHGFHQLVLFAAIVMVAAVYGVAPGSYGRAARRGLVVIALGAVAAAVLGPLWNRGLVATTALVAHGLPHTIVTLRPAADVQGALALLPAYQLALFFALLAAAARPVRRTPLLLASGILPISQVLLLVGLGELNACGVHVHALALRGWSVLLPVSLALLTWWATRKGAPSGDAKRAVYRSFWDEVGSEFPDLSGAASTALYREGERRLVARYLPDLAGKRVLKSDLWDEARNTHILQWIGQQGAHVFGIDISKPTVDLARREFHGAPLYAAGADVRALPFRDGSFDAIYSMGTIEHFAETDQAMRELLRVLKPGGRAIIGVPNRHDPFLRPLMVAVLYRLGLYGYGFEKCYSRATLRKMLEDAGFVFVADDGVLFIPGWLRMLDLLCHTRFPRLAGLTGVAVRLFSWLERNVPAVHRHGYLIAAIVERPHTTTESRRFSAVGREWMIDAFGCSPEALRSREVLQSIFAAVVADTRLHTVGEPLWHVFEGEAGVTGLQGLCESHLACHTYPEAGYAAFSLYCCRADIAEWPWQERLAQALGATSVTVRMARRGQSETETSKTCSSPAV
jgi:S-adenosylmethionine decarboxylase